MPRSYSTTQPNALTSTTGATGGSTSYTYYSNGDTETRDTALGNQTLTWNNNDTLAQVSTSTSTTTYVYDADGNLLIQADPTTTTLYLGTQQFTLTTATHSVAGIRYYPLPGGGTAVRTSTGNAFSFEITDQQGTSDLYLDYTAHTPTWRQFDPYGNVRGGAVAWIDNRTTMDKTTDAATGLTNVAARYLDPTIGRFVSLDPVLETTDPLALNGYGYTSDNPVTQDDPSGERACNGSKAECGDGSTGQAPTGGGGTTGTTNTGGSNNGNSSSGAPTIAVISKHVLAYSNNPNLARLQADWAYVVSVHGQPTGIDGEAFDWENLCNMDPTVCQGGMRLVLGAPSSLGADSPATMDLKGGILLTGDEETGNQGIRSLNDMQSMRGATIDEVEALANDAGLVRVDLPDATGGEGARFFNPEDKRIMIMWEIGEVGGQTDDLIGQVHQGPYLKYQIGKRAFRVPLAGNPYSDSGNQTSGPELLTDGFFDESGGGLSGDPSGGLDAAP